jgi:hypothetical protein
MSATPERILQQNPGIPLVAIKHVQFATTEKQIKQNEVQKLINFYAESDGSTPLLVIMSSFPACRAARLAAIDVAGVNEGDVVVYADLPPEDRAEAVRRAKVILGTNAIRTGVTFPHADVCDTGLIRVPIFLGHAGLRLTSVFRTNARLKQQGKGRTSRTKPGTYYYVEPDSNLIELPEMLLDSCMSIANDDSIQLDRFGTQINFDALILDKFTLRMMWEELKIDPRNEPFPVTVMRACLGHYPFAGSVIRGARFVSDLYSRLQSTAGEGDDSTIALSRSMRDASKDGRLLGYAKASISLTGTHFLPQEAELLRRQSGDDNVVPEDIIAEEMEDEPRVQYALGCAYWPQIVILNSDGTISACFREMEGTIKDSHRTKARGYYVGLGPSVESRSSTVVFELLIRLSDDIFEEIREMIMRPREVLLNSPPPPHKCLSVRLSPKAPLKTNAKGKKHNMLRISSCDRGDERVFQPNQLPEVEEALRETIFSRIACTVGSDGKVRTPLESIEYTKRGVHMSTTISVAILAGSATVADMLASEDARRRGGSHIGASFGDDDLCIGDGRSSEMRKNARHLLALVDKPASTGQAKAGSNKIASLTERYINLEDGLEISTIKPAGALNLLSALNPNMALHTEPMFLADFELTLATLMQTAPRLANWMKQMTTVTVKEIPTRTTPSRLHASNILQRVFRDEIKSVKDENALVVNILAEKNDDGTDIPWTEDEIKILKMDAKLCERNPLKRMVPIHDTLSVIESALLVSNPSSKGRPDRKDAASKTPVQLIPLAIAQEVDEIFASAFEAGISLVPQFSFDTIAASTSQMPEYPSIRDITSDMFEAFAAETHR